MAPLAGSLTLVAVLIVTTQGEVAALVLFSPLACLALVEFVQLPKRDLHPVAKAGGYLLLSIPIMGLLLFYVSFYLPERHHH
jgi:hypothetical protein